MARFGIGPLIISLSLLSVVFITIAFLALPGSNVLLRAYRALDMDGGRFGLTPRTRLHRLLADFASGVRVVSCPNPPSKRRVDIAVLLTTSQYYRDTRLRHVLGSWARHAQALMVASDAVLEELPGDVGQVVVWNGCEDFGPFVPRWKVGSVNARDKHGKQYPKTDASKLYCREASLRDRILVALHVLRECLPEVGAVLVADDDSFVPMALLNGSLNPFIDMDGVHLYGSPISSSAFVFPWLQRQFENSTHCAGGAGMMLTRGLLKAMDVADAAALSGDRLAFCFAAPFPVSLHVDVSLGICGFLLGARCEVPPVSPSLWSCHLHGTPTSELARLEGERSRPSLGVDLFSC